MFFYVMLKKSKIRNSLKFWILEKLTFYIQNLFFYRNMLSDIINDHISEERLKELELEEVKSMFIFLDIYVISFVMKLLYNNKCPIVCLQV